MEEIRIGVLGAANIVSTALLDPSRLVSGVTVTSIAARSPDRARAFAETHGIPCVHEDYADLLVDPHLDAVYIPLPAALHGRWTIAAVEAGKHVLCEKPFTANADQAEAVLAATRSSDRVVMEAHHSRYHPLQQRLAEIIASGELGPIRTAIATFCVPLRSSENIRWDLTLGGGGLLDVGYYPVRLLRDLFGPVPEVAWARAEHSGGVDRTMDAGLRFIGDVAATVVCSIGSERPFASSLELVGDAGRLEVVSPFHPQLNGRLRILGPDGQREEHPDPRSSYAFQLEAFRDALRTDAPVPTDPAAALAQLRTIDAVYRAAGLLPRPGVP